MADELKPIQVNTDFTKNPELLTQLDDMVREDESDRSKFIRKLIRQEYARRRQLSLPLVQPSPVGKKSAKRQTSPVTA